ncbi:hypothetical protein ACFXHA_04185 [Nocardia sp. NPDC059240]|uniref:hypothetical protein n=1 Tax=Nocardia sp. NPDC059240 TaxID=3346786 RepID=UPI00367F269A
MGFSSSWLLLRNTVAEEACAALGVRRSGVYTAWPRQPLSGTARPDDSYLVVEDRSLEMLEDTWDLGLLSLGREIVAAAEIDGAGYGEVSVWRDGRKVWGIASPNSSFMPRISGYDTTEIRARMAFDEYLEYVESKGWTEDSDDWEDDFDEVDWFNPILRLASDLTGYICGTPIAAPGKEPFEILVRPSSQDAG